MNYFISAIGTDSGKTVVSSLLVEGLVADYWKPVQAGFPTDSATVRTLITNKKSHVHPEGVVLKTPESPHSAAEREGLKIEMKHLLPPITDNRLIVEGAGGLLVPINRKLTMIDLIRKLGYPVILVSNTYLGSINHTLLSCELLQSQSIPVKGIVFNGPVNQAAEEAILSISAFPLLFRLPFLEKVNSRSITEMVINLKTELSAL